MAGFILSILVGIGFSFHAGFYLYDYYTLVKSGEKTIAEIVAFDKTDYILFRNVFVPIVSFKPKENLIIQSIPVHSYFTQINYFQRKDFVTAYYQLSNPERFVIENKIELIVNGSVILVTFCSILWLFLR